MHVLGLTTPDFYTELVLYYTTDLFYFYVYLFIIIFVFVNGGKSQQNYVPHNTYVFAMVPIKFSEHLKCPVSEMF